MNDTVNKKSNYFKKKHLFKNLSLYKIELVYSIFEAFGKNYASLKEKQSTTFYVNRYSKSSNDHFLDLNRTVLHI